MAQIPTIVELRNSIKQSLEAALGFAVAVFGKAFLNAMTAVQAAKLKLIWLAIGEVQKNIWPDTADIPTLLRFGLVKIGRTPFTATQGKYEVTITGTIGAVVPAGTVFKADDTSAAPGKLFILDVEKTLTLVTDAMQLRALEAGLDSRLAVADTLTSTSPLLNVDDVVIVAVEDEIPLAAEDIEAYRAIVVRAFQFETEGGAATDYKVWSADAQGVRFVYPYTTSGQTAEIDLYVEANQIDSIDGKGTPTPAILADVEAVVEFDPDTSKPTNERGRRPLGAHEIHFLSIAPKDVVITFVNAVGFDIPTQVAITTALTTEIDDIRPFVDAADILSNKNDTLDINKVISIAQGLLSPSQQFDSITMTVDAVPVTTSITFTGGDIPFLDSIIF